MSSEFKAFITRLHFYIGLFVGPFIFAAAVSGTLYVLTPQVDDFVFRDYLRASPTGENRSLKEQLETARAYIGDRGRLHAVRPSTGPGVTTRVLFSNPDLRESETIAVFVDPVTLNVKGDLIVYGTSGVLPIRRLIDTFHRNLLLGDLGRNYSELAASWLWIATLGGVALWFWRRRTASFEKATATRKVHATLGIWIAAGLVFLSATGLTWSKYAGDNIDALRGTLGWTTPSVSLKLNAETASAPVADPASLIDAVYATARSAGLDSPMLELRPSRTADRAWLVREYDRTTPTQVDTVAVDPGTMTITSRADFATFTIIPKLIRWGIDIHMGVKFGVLNQIAVGAVGIALSVSILYGYVLWWKRRPAPGLPVRSLVQSWLYLGTPSKAGAVVVAVALGWALPLMGLTVAAFVLVDLVRWYFGRRAQRRSAETVAA